MRALYELAQQKSIHQRDAQDALFFAGAAIAIAKTFPGGDFALDQGFKVRIEIFEHAARFEEAYAEAKTFLERLEVAGDLEAPRGIELRARMASYATRLDRHDEADSILASLLDEPQKAEGTLEIARAYTVRAHLRKVRGETDGAVADQLQAHKIYARLLGPRHLNAAGRLGDIALALAYADRLDESRNYGKRAIAALTVEHDGHADAALSQLYENLGWVELNLGNLDASMTALDQSDRWAADLRGSVMAQKNWRARARGRIAEARGNFEEARALFSRATKTTTNEKNRLACSVGLNIADLHASDTPAARAALESALDHPETNNIEKARAAWGLALAEARDGQADTARRHLARARKHLGEVPYERMLERKLLALEQQLDSVPPTPKSEEPQKE